MFEDIFESCHRDARIFPSAFLAPLVIFDISSIYLHPPRVLRTNAHLNHKRKNLALYWATENEEQKRIKCSRVKVPSRWQPLQLSVATRMSRCTSYWSSGLGVNFRRQDVGQHTSAPIPKASFGIDTCQRRLSHTIHLETFNMLNTFFFIPYESDSQAIVLRQIIEHVGWQRKRVSYSLAWRGLRFTWVCSDTMQSGKSYRNCDACTIGSARRSDLLLHNLTWRPLKVINIIYKILRKKNYEIRRPTTTTILRVHWHCAVCWLSCTCVPTSRFAAQCCLVHYIAYPCSMN